MAQPNFKTVPPEDISDDDAWAQVEVLSVLWPAPLMAVERIMQQLDDTIMTVVKSALSELGTVPLIVRDLAAVDLGRSVRGWNQQLVDSNNNWVTSVFDSTTKVPDNTFVGIVGAMNLTPQGSVGGVRIQVGGARVVEWDLQKLFMPYGAAGSSMDLGRYGISLSPVIATQNKEVTIDYYARGAANITILPVENPLLGVTVETVGGGSAGLVP